jgi:type IV pilus assembly protein PilQ
MNRKNCHSSLIVTGVATLLLGVQPLQAATPEQDAPSQNGNVFPQENSSDVGEKGASDSPKWMAQMPMPPSTPVGVPPAQTIPQNNVPNNPTITTQPIPTSAPTTPRAVAPPVGDMAISNINAASERIKFGLSVSIPRLVLREAPVREVLTVIAKYAGFNVLFLDGQGAPGQGGSQTVSLDLSGENAEDVFNSVLMISGLKANRQGKTIFIGATLPQSARNLVSRTIRLNQAKADKAAGFLASQGAAVNILFTQQQQVFLQQNSPPSIINSPPTLTPLTVQGTTSEALILKGLQVTTDERLNMITLTGEPNLVDIATSMLVQLDARRRQVAVNVKVIDVTLDNTNAWNTSFSFGIDNTGVIQDAGVGVINFGTNNQNLNGFPSPGIPNPGQISPFRTGTAIESIGAASSAIVGRDFNVAKAFLAQLQFSLKNGNAKILTDPTVFVQEGEFASVKLVNEVITSINSTQTAAQGGVITTITPVKGEVGLLLKIILEKIDDNGFISLRVRPEINSVSNTVNFNTGGSINSLTLLAKRELESGLVRIRDGQTLILSGIISEVERANVSKIPVLGDLPIVGALFRNSSNVNQRNEVIIVLTPKVIEDNYNTSYYTPGRDAAPIIQQQGFPLGPQP